MTTSVPPFLVFFAGAALVLFCGPRLRAAVMLVTPVVGLINLFQLAGTWQVPVFELTLELVHADRLSLLFGVLFHVAALISIVFSLHSRDKLQQGAGLIYAGGALGAVFAGDLMTLFLFWEILAVSSVFLVWARRSARAHSAGWRYLAVQIASGLLLFCGVSIHYFETGSMEVGYIGLNSPASWLILVAFGIKCAFPLLHNWLVDAYPEATPTGTVFLSAFTTKVAVYALVRCFPGTELLIYVGVVMTLFPVFYAVIENDLRRVLAYSMINQLGFMVCGIGLGTELAINGAVSHAFNDVVFKGLLFMSMGAVLHMTGAVKGSEIGGLYKTMPWTTGFCIIGAASISAFPLFSGFVSKSMVMAAALEEGYPWVWLALLFASAGVLHHAGIKIPFHAFFAKDSGIRVSDPPVNMLIAMAIAAGLCIFNGSYPAVLYGMLPFPVTHVPYDVTHVLTQMQLLVFAILAFCWLRITDREPHDIAGVNLDSDWTYRRLAPVVVARMGGALKFLADGGRAFQRDLTVALTTFAAYAFGAGSGFARTWLTRTTVLVATIAVGLVLVLN